jgi:hypothetical protein
MLSGDEGPFGAPKLTTFPFIFLDDAGFSLPKAK